MSLRLLLAMGGALVIPFASPMLGAGEGIRTLDIDLGKVALYP